MAQKASEDKVLARTDFPPYCVSSLDGNIVILAGGGGSAKTGVKNKFEVYTLEQTATGSAVRLVTSHDVGQHCVSNMAAWTLPRDSSLLQESIKKCPDKFKSHVDKGLVAGRSDILLAIGAEERCLLYRLTPSLVRQEANGTKAGVNGGGTTRRRGGGGGPRGGIPVPGVPGEEEAPPHNVLGSRDNTSLSYSVQQLSSFQTVFSSKEQGKEDFYQKVCRISPDKKILLTAGTDGQVRLWDLKDPCCPRLLQTLKAHSKEVDSVDLSPCGKHVVSVCKLSRECSVWDWRSDKRLQQLALDLPGGKYKFSRARYSVAQDSGTERLFTLSIPLAGSKHPSHVALWKPSDYSLLKVQKVPGVLTNICLSSDGKFLASGTMEGDIVILIAFSLQPLQRVPAVHSYFVSGLDWLESFTRSSCIARGFSDASLLSVSCDNTLQVVHVPSPSVLPLWLAALLSLLTLLLTFLLASYLDL